MKDGSPDFKEWVFLIIFTPIIALFFGGIYLLLAVCLTKERDPWFTLILGLGLSITVFGLGHLSQTPLTPLCWAYLASIALLLLVRFTYGLKNNLEHFAMVHQGTLIIFMGVAAWHAST